MIVMYDSIVTDELPNEEGAAYAGYVSGEWPDYASIVKRFPKAEVLSVATNASFDADCLDVENGDANISAVIDGLWYARQIKKGATRPCFYMSASLLSAAQTYLQHLPRNSYRLWSAHYTSKHTCGPKSCGYGMYEVDGTQWADGIAYDTSELNDDFFVIQKPPVNNTPAWEIAMLSAMPILKLGDKDGTGIEWVRRVQVILTGIFGYVLSPDGVYGPLTEDGVKWLERKYGIPQNGTVGEWEWQILCAGSHA